MSIKKQIIFLILLVTVVPFGIIVYSGINQRNHDLSQAVAIAASVAAKVQAEQDILVSGAEQLAVTLSHIPAVRDRKVAEANRILTEIVASNPQYSTIFLLDRNGVCWAAALPSQLSLSYADRRYVQNALSTGRFSSGEYTIGKVIRAPIFSFGYPFKDRSGAITGVVAIVINLERYRHLYGQNNSDSRASILLLDHKGTMLYSSLYPPSYIGTPDKAELFRRMADGPDTGTFEAVGNLGTERLFAYRKIRLKGEETPYMYVRSGMDRNSVVADIHRHMMINGGVLSAITLLMIGLALYLSKRGIFDKIVTLRDATQQIAQGNLDVRVADRVSGGELGELGAAFDDMAHRLAENVAERKRAKEEREKLETQLVQAQKLESIGRLAGGIAHDFNNMLTPIMGCSQLLAMNMAPGSDDYEMATRITKAAERAKGLTQQLLSFSRKQILEMKVLDLNEVITSFHDILRRTIRENIDIRLHLTEETHGINADRHQLEQIILNLAVNAQDAISGEGIITIETTPITLDDEYVQHHTVVKAGSYLLLVVSDTGKGMDRETRERIFEPFFTTKEVGQGTGLGLATVYGLVKQHGGNIWVYSEVGKGSTFKLYFPLADRKPAEPGGRGAEGPALNADGRTILLVEDDEMVRKTVYDFLYNLGFNLMVAESPKEALKMSAGQQIDLLVTDVVMPGMNGPELYQRLSESREGLKALYMSGYTNNVIVHHGILNEGINFIQKPFSLSGLTRKVAAILQPD